MENKEKTLAQLAQEAEDKLKVLKQTEMQKIKGGGNHIEKAITQLERDIAERMINFYQKSQAEKDD